MYAQLLIDLFKYLAPFLRNVELNKPMQILYKVGSHFFLMYLSVKFDNSETSISLTLVVLCIETWVFN